MIANVNEQVWIDFDLDTAVFLDTIAYWVKKNALNKQSRHFHEGRYWTYNTLEAYHKMFPGWSTKTIHRIITKCVKNDLLLINNFNKRKYDRTSWYSISDVAIKYYPYLSEIIHQNPDNPEPDSFPEIEKSFPEIETPIPKLLPSSSNNTITTNSEFENSRSSSSDNENVKSDNNSNHDLDNSGVEENNESSELSAKSDYQKNQIKNDAVLPNVEQIPRNRRSIKREKGSKIELRQLINIYCEIFPNNPQPHPKTISTGLKRTLESLVKKWPEAHPNGYPMSYEGFRKYMIALRDRAPKFSLGEYVTKDGNKKKNNMETFCRWNTFVKFLENSYS